MKSYSRRDIVKLGALAIPAAGLLGSLGRLRAAEAAAPRAASGNPPALPNSKVNGVQIGMNVPYNFGNNSLPGDEILANCIKLGVNGLELRSQPVELFLGVPAELAAARGGGRRGAPADPAVPAMTAEERAAALEKWRLGVSME